MAKKKQATQEALEDQARRFNYNLKRFSTAMLTYESRLNNVGVAQIRQKQAADGGLAEDNKKWGEAADLNTQSAQAELMIALESFGALKELLKS